MKEFSDIQKILDSSSSKLFVSLADLSVNELCALISDRNLGYALLNNDEFKTSFENLNVDLMAKNIVNFIEREFFAYPANHSFSREDETEFLNLFYFLFSIGKSNLLFDKKSYYKKPLIQNILFNDFTSNNELYKSNKIDSLLALSKKISMHNEDNDVRHARTRRLHAKSLFHKALGDIDGSFDNFYDFIMNHEYDMVTNFHSVSDEDYYNFASFVKNMKPILKDDSEIKTFMKETFNLFFKHSHSYDDSIENHYQKVENEESVFEEKTIEVESFFDKFIDFDKFLTLDNNLKCSIIKDGFLNTSFKENHENGLPDLNYLYSFSENKLYETLLPLHDDDEHFYTFLSIATQTDLNLKYTTKDRVKRYVQHVVVNNRLYSQNLSLHVTPELEDYYYNTYFREQSKHILEKKEYGIAEKLLRLCDNLDVKMPSDITIEAIKAEEGTLDYHMYKDEELKLYDFNSEEIFDFLFDYLKKFKSEKDKTKIGKVRTLKKHIYEKYPIDSIAVQSFRKFSFKFKELSDDYLSLLHDDDYLEEFINNVNGKTKDEIVEILTEKLLDYSTPYSRYGRNEITFKEFKTLYDFLKKYDLSHYLYTDYRTDDDEKDMLPYPKLQQKLYRSFRISSESYLLDIDSINEFLSDKSDLEKKEFLPKSISSDFIADKVFNRYISGTYNKDNIVSNMEVFIDKIEKGSLNEKVLIKMSSKLKEFKPSYHKTHIDSNKKFNEINTLSDDEKTFYEDFFNSIFDKNNAECILKVINDFEYFSMFITSEDIFNLIINYVENDSFSHENKVILMNALINPKTTSDDYSVKISFKKNISELFKNHSVYGDISKGIQLLRKYEINAESTYFYYVNHIFDSNQDPDFSEDNLKEFFKCFEKETLENEDNKHEHSNSLSQFLALFIRFYKKNSELELPSYIYESECKSLKDYFSKEINNSSELKIPVSLVEKQKEYLKSDFLTYFDSEKNTSNTGLSSTKNTLYYFKDKIIELYNSKVFTLEELIQLTEELDEHLLSQINFNNNIYRLLRKNLSNLSKEESDLLITKEKETESSIKSCFNIDSKELSASRKLINDNTLKNMHFILTSKTASQHRSLTSVLDNQVNSKSRFNMSSDENKRTFPLSIRFAKENELYVSFSDNKNTFNSIKYDNAEAFDSEIASAFSKKDFITDKLNMSDEGTKKIAESTKTILGVKNIEKTAIYNNFYIFNDKNRSHYNFPLDYLNALKNFLNALTDSKEKGIENVICFGLESFENEKHMAKFSNKLNLTFTVGNKSLETFESNMNTQKEKNALNALRNINDSFNDEEHESYFLHRKIDTLIKNLNNDISQVELYVNSQSSEFDDMNENLNTLKSIHDNFSDYDKEDLFSIIQKEGYEESYSKSINFILNEIVRFIENNKDDYDKVYQYLSKNEDINFHILNLNPFDNFDFINLSNEQLEILSSFFVENETNLRSNMNDNSGNLSNLVLLTNFKTIDIVKGQLSENHVFDILDNISVDSIIDEEINNDNDKKDFTNNSFQMTNILDGIMGSDNVLNKSIDYFINKHSNYQSKRLKGYLFDISMDYLKDYNLNNFDLNIINEHLSPMVKGLKNNEDIYIKNDFIENLYKIVFSKNFNYYIENFSSEEISLFIENISNLTLKENTFSIEGLQSLVDNNDISDVNLNKFKNILLEMSKKSFNENDFFLFNNLSKIIVGFIKMDLFEFSDDELNSLNLSTSSLTDLVFNKNFIDYYVKNDIKDDLNEVVLSDLYEKPSYISYIDETLFGDNNDTENPIDNFLVYLEKSPTVQSIYDSLVIPDVEKKYGEQKSKEIKELNEELVVLNEKNVIVLELLDKMKNTKSDNVYKKCKDELDSLDYSNIQSDLLSVKEKIHNTWSYWYKNISVKLRMFNNSILYAMNNSLYKRDVGEEDLSILKEGITFDSSILNKQLEIFNKKSADITFDDFKFLYTLSDNKYFLISMFFKEDITDSNIVDLVEIGLDDTNTIFGIEEMYNSIKSMNFNKMKKIKYFILNECKDFINTENQDDIKMVYLIMKHSNFDMKYIQKWTSFIKEYNFKINNIHLFSEKNIMKRDSEEVIYYLKKIINHLRKGAIVDGKLVEDSFFSDVGEAYQDIYNRGISDIKLVIDNIDFIKETLEGSNVDGSIILETAKLKDSNLDNSDMRSDLLFSLNSASKNEIENVNISDDASDKLNDINSNLNEYINNHTPEKSYFNQLDNNNFGLFKNLYYDNVDGWVYYENVSPYDSVVYGQGYSTSSCITPDGLAGNILTDMSKRPKNWMTLITYKTKTSKIDKTVILNLQKMIQTYNNKVIEGEFDKILYDKIKRNIQQYFFITGASATWSKGHQATFDNMETNNKIFVENTSGETVRINKSEKYIIDSIKNSAEINTNYSLIYYLNKFKNAVEKGKKFSDISFKDKPLYFTIGSGYSDISLKTFNKSSLNTSNLEENTHVYTDANKDQQFLVHSNDKVSLNKSASSLKDYLKGLKKGNKDATIANINNEIDKIKADIRKTINDLGIEGSKRLDITQKVKV